VRVAAEQQSNTAAQHATKQKAKKGLDFAEALFYCAKDIAQNSGTN
jgi:hypothetical protein